MLNVAAFLFCFTFGCFALGRGNVGEAIIHMCMAGINVPFALQYLGG